MYSENWKQEIITIPNLLSLFRILLIPIYIGIYLNAAADSQYLLAGTVLSISCLTDMADGIIARKYKMITNVGKILDPLADKLTQLALILSLSSKYKLLYLILMLFGIKELFQSCALVFFAHRGKGLTGALWAGKLCTTVLFISLIILVVFPHVSSSTVLVLILADCFFLLFSFVSYFLAYFGSGNYLTDLKPD